MGKLDATASFYSIQSISNHFFSTLNDHFSILSIELDGKEMMKTILNKENKFTAQVNEVIPKEAIKPAEKGNGQIGLYVFFILLAIVLFYILLSGLGSKKK
jgi:hypothetical protein